MITVRVAESDDDLTACYRICHDEYFRSGFIKERSEDGLRITPYHTLSTTKMLLVCVDEDPAGTLTIIQDGKLGLPMQSDFDLANYKDKNCAEISALAMKAEYQGQRGKILYPMFKYLYKLCWQLNLDYLFAAIHPDRWPFFKDVLLFKDLNQPHVDYEFVNGAKAMGIYLNLKEAAGMFEERYDLKTSA